MLQAEVRFTNLRSSAVPAPVGHSGSEMVFCTDYFAARERFCAAVDQLHWQRETHPITARGPRGEELTVDVASSTTDDAATTLLVTGGIHGVEGFFSSALQLAALACWPEFRSRARTLRVVMVHALNPYGFAWVRRANEHNVDPNRNFLCPGERYEGCPAAYRKLHGWLNPNRPPARWESFRLRAALAVVRHGMPALKQTIAGGQYEFPQGLFYGGAEPSQTMKILQANLPRWLQSSRRVLHIDLHTGLGPWGTYKFLVDDPVHARQERWLCQVFGRDRIETTDPRGLAYVTRGDIGQWCVARFPEVDYTYLCAEFGTYAPLHVVAGLRAENQAHHWSHREAPETGRAKRRLQEVFCPQSPDWRRQVLDHGLHVIKTAMLALDDTPIRFGAGEGNFSESRV